jgi:hypothetical protein
MFRLANTATMRNVPGVSPIAPKWDPTLAMVYNRPGSFSVTVPIDSDFALSVQKHRHCIIAERNGEAKWSGPVTGIADEVSADAGSQDTTKITATGWFEELNRRFIQPGDEASLIFSSGSDTAGAIIFALIGRMNARRDSKNNLVPARITAGQRTDTQTRIRRYRRDQSFGSAITELIDIENGVDISIDPLTRKLNVRSAQAFINRTGVLFVAPGISNANLLRCSNIEDGSQTADSLTVSGSGNRRFVVDDPDAIQFHGVMLEEQIAVTDVTDNSILGAYANAELTYRRYGVSNLSVLPSSLSDHTPRLFDDYELGDQVYLSASRGRMQFRRHPMRVFGTTISVDTEGNEIVSELQITAQ